MGLDHPRRTVGYWKDALAIPIFFAALVLVTLRALPVWALQVMFVAGMVYDGAFTLRPEWHGAPLGSRSGRAALLFLVGFTVVVVASAVAYVVATRT